MKKILFRTFLIVLFLVLVVGFIAYSRGYRFSVKDKTIVPTGILAVSSTPRPAKIYVNGAFKGVTDTNLTLPPGSYTVEVKKEAFTSYKRTLTLKGEIVETVDALLFPVNPSLSPLTNLGIVKVVGIDQTDKFLLFIENAETPERDGVYLFEAARGPISIFPPLKLLVLKDTLPPSIDFSTVTVRFSPKYDQAILDVSDEGGIPTFSYLISLSEETQEPFDITSSRETLLKAWIREKQKQITKILETYPRVFASLVSQNARIIAFSPVETKVFYQARQDFELPLIIKPALIGSNQTKEDRFMKKNKLYVYDRKEDKNFLIPYEPAGLDKYVDADTQKTIIETIAEEKLERVAQEPSLIATATGRPRLSIWPVEFLSFITNSPVQWYPNSRNFVINEEFAQTDEKDAHQLFTIIDYDGTSRQIVYSGPYEGTFFVVTSNGRIVILANLNPQVNKLPDLYEVGIR